MSVEPAEPVLPLDHLALKGARGDPALVLPDRVICHAELDARVGALAGWLAAQVGESGARIAGWLPKRELACLLPLAAARAGLVHVPVNPVLRRAQVAHILSDSGASLLIANPERLATLESGDRATARAVTEAEALAGLAGSGALEPSRADPATLAALLYTSGSTGLAKGVMLSHANLWLGAASVARFLALAPADRILAVLPLAFDYGQNQLLSAWYAGAAVVPHEYARPHDVVRAVERYRITTLAGVPSLWWQLVDEDWSEAARKSIVRLTNSGGALTRPLVIRLRALFPDAAIHAMYGLTEAFRSTSLDPALIDANPTAVGRAIPFAEIMVVNDAGAEAGPDEEGELVHAGPLVAQGYWRDPLRSAARFRPAPAFSHSGGIAVWSGDRVRRDRAGLLHFVGRSDTMIKTSGHRVSPHEIESAALATGLVSEAVALGLPDDRLGQAIHLVVRGGADREGLPERLRQRLARDLPRYMMPATIRLRDAALPTGPNGKLDPAALRAEIAPDPEGAAA